MKMGQKKKLFMNVKFSTETVLESEITVRITYGNLCLDKQELSNTSSFWAMKTKRPNNKKNKDEKEKEPDICEP